MPIFVHNKNNMLIDAQLKGETLVFDTNVLDDLTKGKTEAQIDETAQKILKHKKIFGYKIALDVNVCNELLRQLKNAPTDKHYIRCKKSIYLLAQIVSKKKDGSFFYNPSFYSQLTHFLTCKRPADIVNYDNSVVSFIKDLSLQLNDAAIAQAKRNFDFAEKDWHRNRDNLIQAFTYSIVTDAQIAKIDDLATDKLARKRMGTVLASPDFHKNLTLSHVIYVAKFHGGVPKLLLKFRVNKLDKLLLPANEFFRGFLKKLLQAFSDPVANPTVTAPHNRWNSITDTLIIMATRLSKSILVTTEKDKVIKAYDDSGYPDRVIWTNDYVRMISKM